MHTVLYRYIYIVDRASACVQAEQMPSKTCPRPKFEILLTSILGGLLREQLLRRHRVRVHPERPGVAPVVHDGAELVRVADAVHAGDIAGVQHRAVPRVPRRLP